MKRDTIPYYFRPLRGIFERKRSERDELDRTHHTGRWQRKAVHRTAARYGCHDQDVVRV